VIRQNSIEGSPGARGKAVRSGCEKGYQTPSRLCSCRTVAAGAQTQPASAPIDLPKTSPEPQLLRFANSMSHVLALAGARRSSPEARSESALGLKPASTTTSNPKPFTEG